jgi:uncharacterized RDD family membrane protein YckC
VSAEDPTAVIGRRAAAALVDLLLFAVAQVGLFAAGGGQIARSALSIVWVLAIPVVLTGLVGWTPGKRALGLRTVGEDGEPPGIGPAALRTLMLLVDLQPCGLPAVGVITALTTVGHRRVGDMAAKTNVVSATASA